MVEDYHKQLEIRKREALGDPRSAHELISLALTETDEEIAWDAVGILHLRGTREVFNAACRLGVSACPVERRLAADILGQLGVPKRSFPAESTRLLVPLLALEDDEKAICAICSALGHLGERDAVSALCRLRSHPSADVRFRLAFALPSFEGGLVIETLIGLSSDQDIDVRDWATFGLGTQIDADTVEIRSALFARISDEDEVTRGEAFVGLARRKDSRIIEPLIKELERYPVAEWTYSIAAAEELADPRLLPVLTNLKRSIDSTDTALDEAIRRCSEVGGSAVVAED